MAGMALDTEDWSDAMDRFVAGFERRLATGREYEACLRDLLKHSQCPVAKLRIQVSSGTEFRTTLEVNGEISVGTASTNKWTLELGDSTWVVEAWRSGKSTDGQTIDEAQLQKLVDCFWKSGKRHPKAGLVSLQYAGTRTLVTNYLQSVCDAGQSVACFYVDLDHFKEVNDRLGHEAGDRVIVVWSRLAERLLGKECVVLHRSGDEFVVFSPDATPTRALGLATGLMRATRATDFEVREIGVGCSIGVCVRPPGAASGYPELAEEAERALVPQGGQKQRGKVCLAQCGTAGKQAEEPDGDVSFGLRRALCVMRSELTSRDVFASPWLNSIATVARDVAKTDRTWSSLQKAIDDVVEWFPEVRSGGVDAARFAQEDAYRIPAPRMSRLDVAVAVARGVLAAALSRPAGEGRLALSVRYSLAGDAVELRVNGPANRLWVSTAAHGGGHQWRLESLGAGAGLGVAVAAEPRRMQRACLIKIGHDTLSLLTPSLFAEVITVDDRPTRGGQLPDFWEATVARLIALLGSVPSVKFVYVLGDRHSARETVRRLESAGDWTSDLEQMAYKTGRHPTEVAAASRWIRGVRVFPTEREVVDVLAEDLGSPPTLEKDTSVARAPEPRRFLERRLRADEFCLQPHDGIRVNTIAEAFPVVLEMARKAYAEDVILDAAGQTLRELIDFKVVLRTPTVDRVPAFYQAEADSLDDYLQRAFLADDALFGARLRDGGQVEAVLGHLAKVICGGTKFATRRAILVVPHRVVDGEDLSPLGLVSVRLIPRFLGEQVSILYSFTWRTVEAFVGFPYSLYGSLGFAEHLTCALQCRVGPQQRRRIRMGEVSYIAHSLHMFVDAYGQNIAKRIVDDASK